MTPVFENIQLSDTMPCTMCWYCNFVSVTWSKAEVSKLLLADQIRLTKQFHSARKGTLLTMKKVT